MSLRRVGAGATARAYDLGSGLPTPVTVTAGGGTFALEGCTFALTVDGGALGPSDFELAGPPRADPSGTRLAWVARHPGTGTVLGTEVVADLAAGVVRTRVTVEGTGVLGPVVVERWERPPARGPSARSADAGDDRGLGQPLLGPGWFAGIEHPGAHNLAPAPPAGGGCSFSLPLEVDLRRGPVRLPALVVGATGQGCELSGFWDYLDHVRARPPRLVVLANNWYQLGAVGTMDEASVVAELAGFAAVAERHGLSLEHYCLDDPWDGNWDPPTGLWGRLDPGRFPGGLSALSRVPGAARPALWVSPWGGYFDRHDRRVDWGRANGLEVDDGSWPRLCPAGNRYHAHLAEALGRWTAAGIRYWKLDGVQFDCARPDHGHPVGAGGRTAQIDRFTGLLDRVRAVDPGVVIAFTTGSNPSPWWLRHADFLWRGGLDDDAPATFEGPPAERFDTYIDSCLDRLRKTALPVSAVVTFSLVENQVRAYREKGQDLQAWARHCWLLAGRGSLHHDLYVAPDSLTAEEWDVLASALSWARRHQLTLARARMIGGHPQAGEPYGFAAAHQGRVAGCLRNPSSTAKVLTLTPADLGGGAGALTVVHGRAGLPTSVTDPAGAAVELDPFEVVVFEATSQPAGQRRVRPAPSGGRP